MRVLLLLSLIVLDGIQLQALETVSDVQYDSTMSFKKDTLLLNGAGVREKWFIDLYTVGLYVKEKTTDASQIINCNCAQAFKIVIVSNFVTTEKFNDAIDEVFIKSTQGNTKHIDKRIAIFKKLLGTNLKKGDELLLTYDPEVGLNVFRDQQFTGTVVGLDFKKELMKLWVGEHAVNNDLKKHVLGIK